MIDVVRELISGQETDASFNVIGRDFANNEKGLAEYQVLKRNAATSRLAIFRREKGITVAKSVKEEVKK